MVMTTNERNALLEKVLLTLDKEKIGRNEIHGFDRKIFISKDKSFSRSKLGSGKNVDALNVCNYIQESDECVDTSLITTITFDELFPPLVWEKDEWPDGTIRYLAECPKSGIIFERYEDRPCQLTINETLEDMVTLPVEPETTAQFIADQIAKCARKEVAS